MLHHTHGTNIRQISMLSVDKNVFSHASNSFSEKKGLLWIVSFIISEVHTHSEKHVSLPDNTLPANTACLPNDFRADITSRYPNM